MALILNLIVHSDTSGTHCETAFGWIKNNTLLVINQHLFS